MAISGFIEPDRTLEDVVDPAETLGINVSSDHRVAYGENAFYGRNRIFDRLFKSQQLIDLNYEDRGSGQYYFDLVSTLRDFNGHYDRVAEVGVFMGDNSAFLAGCAAPFDFDVDLIDTNPAFLKFAYERIRRAYPDNTKRIRLFHGDLPSYVRHIIMREYGHSYVIHHGGGQGFEQTVKDIAALSYVRDYITALIVHGTHARSTIEHTHFTDLALSAIFGAELNFAPIGTTYSAGAPSTVPSRSQRNYSLPGAPEGLVLPMGMNTFQYPHPELSMDDFLPPPAPIKEPALARLLQMQAVAAE